MSKHTPGPWRVNSKPDATSGGRTFVVLHEAKPGYSARLDSTYKGEFTEADAALIAAAPEMLTALKTLVAQHNAPYYPPKTSVVAAYMNADAAIAKAEGRS